MVINGRNMSLQAAGALLIPWHRICLILWPFVILPGRKIYQHYHTITANPHIPSDISFGFQFKLDLDIIPQNTTYCSVAQSKEIKVFICNFLSHLSVNVSSYKHFMAIFVQRLLLIISAFNKEKSLQVSWRYLTFVSVNRYKGRT